MANRNHISELEKYKAILLATINYELERVSSIYEADELALVQLFSQIPCRLLVFKIFQGVSTFLPKYLACYAKENVAKRLTE